VAVVFDGRFNTLGNFVGYGLQANGVDTTGFASPTGVSGRLELMLDPYGSGDQVCRHTLYDTDAEAAAGQRSEYYYQPAGALPKTLWYWFAIFIPADWDSSKRMVIMQQHDTPDGGDSTTRTPTMIGYLDTNRLIYLPNSYDPNAVSTPHPNFNRLCLATDPAFGRWQEWVMKVGWSCVPGAGTLDMWIDRRKVYVETAQINTYNDTALPHVKQGVYDYYHVSGFGTRRMYSKGVLVSDTAHASFNAFMTEAGWPSKTELEMVTPLALSIA